MSIDWMLLGLRIFTTVILYSFLGVAFYIIWRDLKQTKVQPVFQPKKIVQLRVLASVDDGLPATGNILPLQEVTFLGRNSNNTIVIPDSAASNRHARLSRDNGVWWLEDLGSRNGTLLNGLPLSKPASLTDGDEITIGSLRFKFETTSK